MKILYIANIRLPTEKAHGIQIMKTCEAFSNADAEVELLIPSRINLEIKVKDPFEYYQIPRIFRIRKLKSLDPIWLWRLPGGIYIKIQTFFFLIHLFFHLFFRQDKNKLIFYTRDEYLSPLLQKFSDKVIWEGHNLSQRKQQYIKYWNFCPRIIVISQGLKEELIALGIGENKILVAPDGVDLEKFRVKSEKLKIKEKLGLPLAKSIVMYTGHLYEWKGAKTLLEAALNSKFTPSSSPPCEGGEREGVIFVFVGGTEDDVKKFKQQAKELDNVLILGHKPYAEIPRYLAAADILVLPNSAVSEISKSYTSPLKMFEYMASGKPIIASDLPSIREILNESNAFFVPPDDPKSLAKKILEVLQNKEIAQRVASQAQEDVKNYSWERRAEKILEFIK